MDQITKSIEIEDENLEWLKGEYSHTDSIMSFEAFVSAHVELALVKAGVSAPERHRIGRQEYVHCAEIALSEDRPLDGVIAGRKARVARAVSEGFRTGAK